MADHRDDLERTEELFRFLQGDIPDGYKIPKCHVPTLTPEQAWMVVWYLGNQYWQVSDSIERCDICGDLFDERREGDCLDFGKTPYHFCGSCNSGEDYYKKLNTRAGKKYAKENGLID